MGYMHIENLYRLEGQDILMFKECWAMEKIHGTSTHIAWHPENGGSLSFFSGGCKHDEFIKLFDVQQLTNRFKEVFPDRPVTVFGEGYGGKMQGMKATYGSSLKFIAFDVKIGEHCWLSVPDAAAICLSLGFEFVHYVKTSTRLEELNALRDAPSVQAMRNGMGEDKKAEGIVLRPLIELRKNNGARIIAKHKRADFQETKTTREVTDEKAKIIAEAEAVAEEFVTEMRLRHVMDKVAPNGGVKELSVIMPAMVEDVLREGSGEFEDSKDVRRAIGTRTAKLVKQLEQTRLELKANE